MTQRKTPRCSQRASSSYFFCRVFLKNASANFNETFRSYSAKKFKRNFWTNFWSSLPVERNSRFYVFACSHFFSKRKREEFQDSRVVRKFLTAMSLAYFNVRHLLRSSPEGIKTTINFRCFCFEFFQCYCNLINIR